MSAAKAPMAILFPGQGVGKSARELVADTRPELLSLAEELIGDDPFAGIGEGTQYAQPAVYCAAMAGFEQLGRPRGEYFAGHSVGEIGALATAGAIDHEDGLRIVVARGLAMAEAMRTQPRGGMLAVGTDRRRAAALAAVHGLTIANENAPQQYVLAGRLDAIEAAALQAKSMGLRRKRLAVSGAFHTASMGPAVEPFRAALERFEFRPVSTPVISCTTARPFGGDVRAELAAALTLPVRWLNVMRKLRQLGATRYLDVGPGEVLARLVRQVIHDAEVETVAGPEPARG
jgi:malonyl CoA-acyl carrier protein transacylase